jgi:hypothetical protein
MAAVWLVFPERTLVIPADARRLPDGSVSGILICPQSNRLLQQAH